MKTEPCPNCGNSARVARGNYRFEEFGLPVELMRIEMIKCSHCGSVDPIIPNMDGLMTAVALEVICSTSLLHGEEIRFLRKCIGKSAQEFSRLLHVDHTHLSKGENNRLEVGPRLDKLVRFVVINLSPNLKDVIDRLLEQLPNIEDSCYTRPEIQIDPSTLQREYA